MLMAMPTPHSYGQASSTPTLSRQDNADIRSRSGRVTVALTLDVLPIQAYWQSLLKEESHILTRAIRVLLHRSMLLEVQAEVSEAVTELGGTIVGSNSTLVTRLLVEIDADQVNALIGLPHVTSVQIVPISEVGPPNDSRPSTAVTE